MKFQFQWLIVLFVGSLYGGSESILPQWKTTRLDSSGWVESTVEYYLHNGWTLDSLKNHELELEEDPFIMDSTFLISFSSPDTVDEISMHYQRELSTLHWEFVRPLKSLEQRNCCHDWGGVYQKDGIKLWIHVFTVWNKAEEGLFTPFTKIELRLLKESDPERFR